MLNCEMSFNYRLVLLDKEFLSSKIADTEKKGSSRACKSTKDSSCLDLRIWAKNYMPRLESLNITRHTVHCTCRNKLNYNAVATCSCEATLLFPIAWQIRTKIGHLRKAK